MPPPAPPERKRPEAPIPLILPPGFHRDATTFSAVRAVDGQHVRWFNGRLRKIGGYTAGATQPNGVVRHLDLFWSGTTGYVHSFDDGGISRMTITPAGVLSAVTARTPAGFTISSNNNWQSAVMYDAASAANLLLAHCTENLNDPGDGTSRPIYTAEVTNTPVLTTTGISVDGGICVLQPYAFGYGSSGSIQWSDANRPTTWAGGDAGNARIAASKIVRGFPMFDADYVAGGGSGATGTFWSLDSVMAARYIGGTVIFRFQTMNEDEISVLSSNAIAKLDGNFYWPGVDCFYVFANGKTQRLPNDSNIDWFFENLNFTHRQKVWCALVRRWGEIWWHFPYDTATECSRALIFNAHETARTGKHVWYDTTIARAAGDRPAVFRWPLWANTGDPATLYRHEVGTNDVDTAGASTAINSYVETSALSLQDEKQSDWLLLKRVEHDATQTGDMTLGVIGREFARAADTTVNYTVTSTQTTTDVMEQRRQMRLRWTSNVLGGDFAMGKPLVHLQPGTGQ